MVGGSILDHHTILLLLTFTFSQTVGRLSNVHDEVQREIDNRCRCGFTGQHLSDGEFQCLGNSDEATYRARLNGTADANSSELIMTIEEWILGDASIVVGGVRLSIDSTCFPVEIASFVDPECMTTAQPTMGAMPDTSSDSGGSDNAGAIAGGIVGGLLGIVAITVIVIVGLFLIRIHHTKSPDKEPE